MKKNLQYNDSGWAELGAGVKLHKSGQGSVVLMGAGLFLPALSSLVENAGATPSADPNLPYEEFTFRMLSKAFISDYNLDFSNGDVLKQALGLFTTKIFLDHDTKVENSIGVTMNPRWTNSKGLEGIDSTYRIFKEFGAGIIGRLKTEPPILDSTSVGVRFTFVKSHPDLEDFYWHLGEKIDGQVVRLIITKILSVPEASIVYSGADPNAKRLEMAGFSRPQDAIGIKEGEAFASRLRLNHIDENVSSPGETEENKKEEKNMKLKAKLFAALGLTLDSLGLELQGEHVELSEDKASVVLEKMGEKLSALEASVNQYAALTDQEKFPAGFDHKENVAKLKSLLDEPKKILDGYKKEALAAYRLFMNGKDNQAIVSMIENANLEQVQAFADQYGAKLNERHPVKRDKDGNLTRGSGELEGDGSKDEYITVKK